MNKYIIEGDYVYVKIPQYGFEPKKWAECMLKDRDQFVILINIVKSGRISSRFGRDYSFLCNIKSVEQFVHLYHNDEFEIQFIRMLYKKSTKTPSGKLAELLNL